VAVTEAVQAAARDLPVIDLVVLTTEPDPVSKSLLSELEVELPLPWKWQERVVELISDAFARLHHHGMAAVPPALSSGQFPTEADVAAIAQWAGQEIERRRRPSGIPSGPWALRSVNPREVPSYGFSWRQEQGRLELVGSSSALRLLSFFSTPRWAEQLPRPQCIRITPGEGRPRDEQSIPLYTVPAYKGLESDGVILFDTIGMGNRAETYVAISRAVALLHIVSHDAAAYSLRPESRLASTKRVAPAAPSARRTDRRSVVP
jgi:hypothetical protein